MPPPAQNRLADDELAPPLPRPGSSMSSIASGGCCRSASITQTHSPRAIRIPSTTAPPRPPERFPAGRWSSRTVRVELIRRIASGVSSSLSSTKITSSGSPGMSLSSLAAIASTFPASSRVGSTTET